MTSDHFPDIGVRLLEAAHVAAQRAYAPYSSFRVGAAVLSGDHLFTGCNIENASYGLSICAERVAIFNAITAGAVQINGLAVTCPDASPERLMERMSCGACLQVMEEFAASDFILYVDRVGKFRLDELLPRPFGFRRTASNDPG